MFYLYIHILVKHDGFVSWCHYHFKYKFIILNKYYFYSYLFDCLPTFKLFSKNTFFIKG